MVTICAVCFCPHFLSPPFNTDVKYTSESNVNNVCNNFDKGRNKRTEKVKKIPHDSNVFSFHKLVDRYPAMKAGFTDVSGYVTCCSQENPSTSDAT